MLISEVCRALTTRLETLRTCIQNGEDPPRCRIVLGGVPQKELNEALGPMSYCRIEDVLGYCMYRSAAEGDCDIDLAILHTLQVGNREMHLREILDVYSTLDGLMEQHVINRDFLRAIEVLIENGLNFKIPLIVERDINRFAESLVRACVHNLGLSKYYDRYWICVGTADPTMLSCSTDAECETWVAAFFTGCAIAPLVPGYVRGLKLDLQAGVPIHNKRIVSILDTILRQNCEINGVKFNRNTVTNTLSLYKSTTTDTMNYRIGSGLYSKVVEPRQGDSGRSEQSKSKGKGKPKSKPKAIASTNKAVASTKKRDAPSKSVEKSSEVKSKMPVVYVPPSKRPKPSADNSKSKKGAAVASGSSMPTAKQLNAPFVNAERAVKARDILEDGPDEDDVEEEEDDAEEEEEDVEVEDEDQDAAAEGDKSEVHADEPMEDDGNASDGLGSLDDILGM